MTGGNAQKTASREVQRFKIAGIVMAAIVLWSSLIPLFGILLDARVYNLSPTASQIVGKVNSNLSAKFSYSGSTKAWQFNREGLALKADAIAEQQGSDDPSGIANALSQMQQQVGGGGKDDKSLYSVNLPQDGSKAVTYYDNNTRQSFKMTPQFSLRDGKLQDGRLIYPLYGGGQLVYTAKTNGLKEDIVLEKSQGDSLDFAYSLDLPKTLEARLQDDGSVGVFSADIALYGNISAGSDMDQAKLDSARETAPKDHLLFALPAPVIKDAEGVEKPGKFTLKGDTLTVHAKGLDKLAYPLSVDPSVVVTSSNDFTTGNNEGGIAYTPSGSMSVASTTGGSFDGTWSSQTNLAAFDVAASHAIPRVAVYNGYLYMINANHVETATIDSSGVIGTWNASPTNAYTINAHGNGTGIVAYNGYLYVVAGQGANTGVEYASIDPSTGAIGTWASTTSLPSATFAGVTVAMNGYLYVAGGYGGATLSTVRYAKINANGTIGSWTATTSLPQVRTTGSGFSYNGYLYVGGGYVDENNTLYSSVIYAKQNSDGTLGSWMTTSSMSQAGPGLAMTVVGGYAYAFGGAATTTYANGSTRAEYAQINANGTLGTWRTNSSMTMTSARTNLGAFSYTNGTDSYVYVLGGRDQATGGYRNTVHSAKIALAGATTSWSSGTSVGTARGGVCTVVYNNYIYAIGGSTANGLTSRVTTVEYASINTTTGAIGTWATTTALSASRTQAGCAAFNGRLYVVGGADPDNTYTATTRYITINSNGTLAASWTNGTNLVNAMLGKGLFTHTLPGGTTNLYALGNYNSTGTIELNYAQINTNGSIGTWTGSGNVPTAANSPAFAKVGNYLYSMGGANSTYTGAFDTVQYATINTDGTVSSWSSTTSLPSQRGFAYGATVNGCIYSIAGYDNSITLTNSVYYACPAANGTISTWKTAQSLATARYNAAATSYNGYIYVVGGGTNTSGAVTATTEYTKVNNGGSGGAVGGAWVADSDVAVVDNRFRHATVVYNGYVYVIAGSVNGGGDITTQTVEYAPINANGTLGSWVADSHEIPAARVFPAAAAYNGYMYMSGGQATGGGAFLKSILYAPISSAGSLSGNWASAGSDTTNGGSGASLVAHNGYLYSLGGWDGVTDFNTVQYAAINSNGTIGSWNSTSNFTTARSNLSPFVYGGYMYIAGGEGASLMNDIQVAQINSNGTLGSWTYTNPFTGARKDTVATAYNGFVYITGGNDSTQSLADVQFAPILSGGIIGPWQRAFAPVNGDPVGARSPSGQAIWNGRLYRAGGAALNGSSSTTMSGGKYLDLDSIARVASYSKRVTLPVQAGTVTVNYSGTFTGDTEVKFATASTNNIFGSLTKGSASVGSDPGGSCLIPTINTVWLTATIDDSRWATFGGGTTSNISEISVFYSDVARPTPNQRLFGGKWFKNEALQGLDICGNV